MLCEKHPNHVRNASPEELAKEFADSAYSYQKSFFDTLWQEYLEQSRGDKKRPSLKKSKKEESSTFV